MSDAAGSAEVKHYGVKGMKWGVRRDDPAASVRRAKPTGSQITDARLRVAAQERRINRQIDRTNLATGKQREREVKKLAEMSTAFLKDPDRATALRLTSGEKFALAAFAVALPGAGTVGAASFGAVRVANRKAVESELKSYGLRP